MTIEPLSTGPTAAQTLARFAVGLRHDDIPDDVRALAVHCIVDTVGCATFGSQLPWSAMSRAYAERYGAGGDCAVFGVEGLRLSAPFAAFANGCAAHAFEQDSLRFPGSGVHPGATLVPTVIAVAQEVGASGRESVRAFVAACEVLFRIGAATHHSSEKLGFHAPGLTGPYGAAIAAGVLYGLDESKLAHALGIAGSMSAGLLAFTRSQQGAMVKRLHMGRACEAGIVAARLASEGFTGPETILEGRFGFLSTYCSDGEAALLTAGFGEEWETRRICMKRYPCHVTAQPALQALRDAMGAHDFDGASIRSIRLHCAPKVASHHDLRHPADVMTAQYSVPFCVALATVRDPLDPHAFDQSCLTDAAIRRVLDVIELVPANDLPTAWSSRLDITLVDGRRLALRANDFAGMPARPLNEDELGARFMLSAAHLGEARASELLESILSLPDAERVPAL